MPHPGQPPRGPSQGHHQHEREVEEGCGPRMQNIQHVASPASPPPADSRPRAPQPPAQAIRQAQFRPVPMDIPGPAPARRTTTSRTASEAPRGTPTQTHRTPVGQKPSEGNPSEEEGTLKKYSHSFAPLRRSPPVAYKPGDLQRPPPSSEPRASEKARAARATGASETERPPRARTPPAHEHRARGPVTRSPPHCGHVYIPLAYTSPPAPRGSAPASPSSRSLFSPHGGSEESLTSVKSASSREDNIEEEARRGNIEFRRTRPSQERWGQSSSLPNLTTTTAATTSAQGPWRDASVSGHVLNIPNVSRWHTGKYVCLANNGMLPSANQTTDVEVHFSPYIRVPNNVVYVTNKTVKIECEIQAWPEPVLAWEIDGLTLEGLRYRTEVAPTRDPWRWIMRLEIPRVTEHDFRKYSCVAKNELNNQTVKGDITLKSAPNGQEQTQQPVEYGSRPPTLTSYEELCEVQRCPTCPRCDRAQLLITPMNGTAGLKPRRNTNCQLYAIGKPVYHRYKEELFGAWLRDSNGSDAQREKLWTTQETDVERLREYRSKASFKADHVDEYHKLQKPFFGNGHIVYSGSFFYQANESGNPGDVFRYDLTQSRIKSVKLPNADGRLYAAQHNQVDFSADDNGLWAIYSIESSNNTAVAKLSFDPSKDGLNIDYVWNISLNHKQVGEMFIVCGVLYALDSATERESKVSVAIDLYLNKQVEVALQFTNPFRKTTQLGYDHMHKELYSWDRGNQLTYPVRYNELP